MKSEESENETHEEKENTKGKLKVVFLFEKDRLESFKSWPFDDKSNCSTRKMAEAGFYWSGNDKENDSASCFLCDKILDGWESTDDPWQEHKNHAPQCPFVKLNKSEKELTIGEFLTIFEHVLKNNTIKRFEQKKRKFQHTMEKKREEIIQFYKKNR